jgi:RNA polymerase sigma-70 factor (ECF subfamily)
VTEKDQQHIFNNWLSEHKRPVFKIVKAYSINPADQEDLFQEISIQLWHSIPAFRQESSAGTWIYRIALNTAMKWISKENKHRKTEPLEQAEYILQENKTTVNDRLAWLYEEIHQLDKVDRSIALLLLDSFSYREMALITGLSETNIGVRINRIKKHLILKSTKNDHHGI